MHNYEFLLQFESAFKAKPENKTLPASMIYEETLKFHRHICTEAFKATRDRVSYDNAYSDGNIIRDPNKIISSFDDSLIASAKIHLTGRRRARLTISHGMVHALEDLSYRAFCSQGVFNANSPNEDSMMPYWSGCRTIEADFPSNAGTKVAYFDY